MRKCQGKQCNLTGNKTIDALSYSDAAQCQLPTPTELYATELERLKEGQWISGDIVTFALQCVSLYLSTSYISVNLMVHRHTFDDLNQDTKSKFWLANTFFLEKLR
jgi:hypothetical protein